MNQVHDIFQSKEKSTAFPSPVQIGSAHERTRPQNPQLLATEHVTVRSPIAPAKERSHQLTRFYVRFGFSPAMGFDKEASSSSSGLDAAALLPQHGGTRK